MKQSNYEMYHIMNCRESITTDNATNVKAFPPIAVHLTFIYLMYLCTSTQRRI